MQENYLKQVDQYVDETTVFPIDGSDIAKPYSVAMEALHEVHDGSGNKIVPGYMTLEIAALTHKIKTPLPIYERVIVHHDGTSVNIAVLASRYKGKCSLKCTLHGENVHCKVTEIPICLPEFGKYPLNLVVVYGFGKDPMYLLTNCRSKAPKFCVAIVKMYLLRWKIEEHFRFKKQQFDFEDFRVRSLAAIRTLHQLVTILTGYLALLAQESDSVVACILREIAKPVPRHRKRRAKTLFH